MLGGMGTAGGREVDRRRSWFGRGEKNAVSINKESLGAREGEKAARGRGQGTGLERATGMTGRDKGQGR